MDALLSATVGFARLLLGALFLANLGSWLARYSATGQIGTILAVGAIGAAWFSQERYMLANNHILARQAAGFDDGGGEYMRDGNIARWLCVALAGLSAVCIVFGP